MSDPYSFGKIGQPPIGDDRRELRLPTSHNQSVAFHRNANNRRRSWGERFRQGRTSTDSLRWFCGIHRIKMEENLYSMRKSEKYNALGYLDLTAYHALKKIEREEAIRQKAMHKHKQKKKRMNTGEAKNDKSPK